MPDLTYAIPREWLDLGDLLLECMQPIYPNMRAFGANQMKGSPYPDVESLPAPLRDWYLARASIEGDASWVVRSGERLQARAPALRWLPGLYVTAYYLAVAGDPGRGTSSRTSDAAPLSLSALSVLSVGLQKERVMMVDLPARELPKDLVSYLDALADARDIMDSDAEQTTRLRAFTLQIQQRLQGNFSVAPVHDLNNQEFALLTQALQRPLQAILNLKIVMPLGAEPEFGPATAVWATPGRQAPRTKDKQKGARIR